MKKLLILLLSAWFYHATAIADVGKLPERTVENVADGILVTYEFPSPFIQSNSLVQGTSFLRYNGFGINDIAGEPAIPFRSDLFYIPKGYSTCVDTIEMVYNDTILILSPSVPSYVRNKKLEFIDSIKPYHGFFPNQIIESSAIDDYRGEGLQRVTITPVQYDNENHIVRFYSKIKYKISFLRDEANARGIIHSNDENRNIKDFLYRATLNYRTLSSSLPRDINNTEPDTTNYLIITVNEYLDSLQSFIEWKRIKGNNVFLQARNRGEWTTENIKNVINQMDSLYSLDYVLFVGGFDEVPADSFSYIVGFDNYEAVTDYSYGLPTSNLQIPKISRGRIPVDNIQELSTVLNKIIKYERSPIRNDDFYKRALHCGEFSDYNKNKYEDMCCIQTNENIREHLIHNYNYQINRSYYYIDYFGGPNPNDILHWNNNLYGYGAALPDSLQPSSYFEWKDNNIISSINEGVLYVLYNGHGSIGGWQAPGFGRDVDSLQNGDKQPIVFSLACLTGKYNENGNCFVEKMLKKENGGCVGIFASTESVLPGYTDTMGYGMFDVIWPNLQLSYDFNWYSPDLFTPFENSVYELGKVLDFGLLRMSETFGHMSSSHRDETKKLFHFFGHPSMMIYTDVPKDFESPNIKYINGRICVQSPCDSTRITFYTPSSTTPIVDSFIGNYVEYETNADSIIICLDKHNYVPHVQTFYKNLYIQNETINDNRNYVGENILVGNHVTAQKPQGDVLIENAEVSIQGNSVKLHPGTKIIHSNVKINVKNE